MVYQQSQEEIQRVDINQMTRGLEIPNIEIRTEISRFVHQSTQFLTEIMNLIVFLLKNVIKKSKNCNIQVYLDIKIP